MPTASSPQIAVIGSGPAGCYFAQSLLRLAPGSTVTLFDRMVSPFGLIRYGVAADHQHTKAITRQFDRLFQSAAVRFAGNLTVGRDISLEDLRQHFDAVVIATGLSADRALEIPGAQLPGIIGAGTVTRTLNAHPDERTEISRLGPDVVIVGAGNVALDVLRFLVKGPGDYAASDISDPALEAYLAAPAQRITLISRSGVADSKGDPQMWKELATLARGTYTAPEAFNAEPSPEGDRTSLARITAVADLVSAARAPHAGPRVTLRFGATPERVLGTVSSGVTGVEISSALGRDTIPASAVITAIGFDAATQPAALLPEAPHSLDTGRLEAGLYRTGWAKRGPRGAIPENRACAKSVAEELAADLAAGTLAPTGSKRGFTGLPATVQAQATSYADWLVLDEHEREHAATDRVRQKFTDHQRMVDIARGAAVTTQS